MLYSGKVLGLTAIRLMEHPEIIQRAKEEWKVRLQNETYTPIPKDVHPTPIEALGKE